MLLTGTVTPKSPTIRSPTFSGSPICSAQNSDTENDPKTPGYIYIYQLAFLFLINNTFFQ
jgi:hypothetical protein